MLSQRSILLAVVVCLTIVSLTAGAATGGTVTVNVSAKSATSDTKTLDAKAVRKMNEQVGVYVESTLLTPQQVTIKFDGLKDEDYDVYTNGEYSGVKSGKLLKEGVEKTIPGTVVDQTAMRCIKALKPKVTPVYNSVHARKGAEPWRAAYTLRQASDWVDSGIGSDQKYRSVDVIVTPAGNPLERMVFSSRMDAARTAAAVLNVCDLLQKARANMYEVLTDASLRNEVVDAMTPVTMTATYSLKNGKPVITASIVNDCDMTITGKITVSAPKGWKPVGAKLDIGKLKSGKTYSTTFSLASSTKNAASPKSVPLSAVVDLIKNKMGARLWLYATATSGK